MCSCLAGLRCCFVFLSSNSDRISCDLFLVNNFFHFLENQFRSMRSYCLVRSCSLEQRIVLYHRCFRIASSFFKFLKTSNSVSRIHLAKRRKRDLNPFMESCEWLVSLPHSSSCCIPCCRHFSGGSRRPAIEA